MRIILILLLVPISLASYGQLYINEFMASNASTIEDPDYYEDADWIELYNAGEMEVNLNGYYLTDDKGVPNKWKIGNINIGPHGFAIFWADGKDSSNHTGFNLNALSEFIGLYNVNLKVIDSISYSNQSPDVSEGRNINNYQQWGYYATATPNTANITEFFTGFAANEPQFNYRGGIYNSNLSIIFSTDMGGVIRYTLDGSAPTLSSPVYASPITVNNTTVIRARIFKPEMVPGPIITNSYFINESIIPNTLPVVSLSTNPENFWDPQIGIYVQNFKPDWEVPVNIEMFENNGSDRAAFNEMAGVKINGLYSWKLPQKMLGVYFRKQYGTGTLDYTLFYDSPRSGFKTFALRASGNDWSNTLMRDILGQNATQLNMNLDISAFRWCTVYVNGQYMGIHNFREKIETDYIEKHYGLAAGTFDMVENEDYAECGDLYAYNDFKTLIMKDLSVPANFDAVAEEMDIENFTDMVIAEMASGNYSIDHNVMAWKPKDSGKWRWILMDLDRGYTNTSSQLISFYLGQTSFPFGRLMANDDYKKYFGQRLADQLFTSFHPETMKKLINSHRIAIEQEIPAHVERWLGTTSSYGDAMPSVDYWYNEVNHLEDYVQARPQVLLTDLNNYGFDGTANLSVAVYPENAGTLTLNGLKIPLATCTSPYLKYVEAEISADEKAGFTFVGWKNPVKKVLVPKKSTWKYLDDGSNQGAAWKESAFNDNSWNAGLGEFGYGDGDETTVVSYGNNSQNKYITTYFRHTFTLTKDDLTAYSYTISLLKDDGAIVYLNGKELVRDNISSGEINYKTMALSSVAGSEESTYNSFLIDQSNLLLGTNVLAVEVHQITINSTDLSFDLELSSSILENTAFISTDLNYPFTLTEDISLVAVFESDNYCMIPTEIAENTTLSKSCSPFIVQNDVTVKSGVALTIEPGVEIWMSPSSNFYIHGAINAIGTSAERIVFKINPTYDSEGWGALNFWNSSATSNLSYVTVDDATCGPIPQRVGAIASFYGNVKLDNLIIENSYQNPISARYSDVTLTNSYIHSNYTGDLINIKYGNAIIENCTFVGNSEFDSDGIDYDGIADGIIRNTKLYNIVGFNADAVDIGEEATNILIDSVLIYNVFDKGISVGQRSSVVLTNSTFVNCNMGVGVKDSSSLFIDHCIFYGNGTAVSCYEKNLGRAGGNALIQNSILSNASLASFQSDSKSSIQFKYCLSDNDLLTAEAMNKFGNPLFTAPTYYNFNLLAGSPCIGAGYENGKSIDLGTNLPSIDQKPNVLICQFYINPLNTTDAEYIAIYNPTPDAVDVSNYSIDKGITCTVPQGTTIDPQDTLFVTDQAWLWSHSRNVVQWTEGKLSNNGESIQLLNQYGIVVDYIKYSVDLGWPVDGFDYEYAFTLNNLLVDNHFPENWSAMPVVNILSVPQVKNSRVISIYPNPATDKILISANNEANSMIEIFSPIGQLVMKSTLDENGTKTIDISSFTKGIYLIKVGKTASKIIVN